MQNDKISHTISMLSIDKQNSKHLLINVGQEYSQESGI